MKHRKSKSQPSRRGRSTAERKSYSAATGTSRQGGRSRNAAGRSAAGVQEGVVSAHRSGFGFVRVEGQELSVFLPPPQMTGLTSGDRVRVRVTRDPAGRLAGEVEAVLARGVSAFLATVEGGRGGHSVHAVDRRLGLRCHVPDAQLGGARAGDWVIARITRYPEGHSGGLARVEKRLDPDRPLELAIESAIARVDLPTEFSGEALKQAEAFGERIDSREARGRVDLRALPLVTIDGEDARDFDDAVYAERQDRGFRLVVAIADVSHYVRPGTELDAQARARGTSVYFPTRVLPMLPTALSDHLCSLEPEVDRLCMVADMQVMATGKLGAAKFYPAVMRSHARLTYTQAHAALFEGRPDARRALGALLPSLEPLVEVYRALLKARNRRGALDFDSAEPKFEFDTEDRVRAVAFQPRNDAHRLIEECMILANVAVARELRSAQAGALFRVHAVPEEKKLDALQRALAALGVAAELPEQPQPRDLRRITERLGKTVERPFVESLVVRAMPQALYQPTNIGHFGLALTEYAHFTSPIRRYPDLVVHRALKAIGNADDRSGLRYGLDELGPLGQDLSRLEKQADESDRYVDTFLKCSYLRARLGQTFVGIVSTVVEYGCFVQLVDLAVDGLLHLDALRDDDYQLADDGQAWIGRHTRRRLALGARLRVIVTNANPVEGLIDLELDR
ncbi:MAG: ribonuclease R [Steroidobacteraceae bacterium]|nr:ribonuclease R [Nevskiaceae bacterium]MCP5359801.1 ribonuclease R [Nevskiaceae bacterium]MCP5467402.1 ribonuclease R [Nevskiaceae bacterium]MCP5472709.1 ribonuclease R [Nevskiaceae bacterium]